MNILVSKLARGDLGKELWVSEGVLIEDNVGESIHIHYWNMRIDLTVDGFLTLADQIEDSLDNLEEGDDGDR